MKENALFSILTMPGSMWYTHRAQKNGAGRPMKSHGHLYGAHYLKQQLPARSSSTVAASPCASPKDAGATKLTCLALHCAYVMEKLT